MPVPSYDQFIEPVVRFLAAHPEGAPVADVQEAVANVCKLSADDRALLLPSGIQAVYKNRIGWAHDRLKRAGLSSSVKRGFWKLTDSGVALATKYAGALPKAELEKIAFAYVGNALLSQPARANDESARTGVKIDVAGTESPEERIESALAELRESVSRNLLERILAAPPSFFENLVLELLHSMGYGTSRSDLQQVGGSGDGGIDGIISLDRLGLQKVYVQAKRWQNDVGAPAIRDFIGALHTKGADRGVFLTTAGYTREARDIVDRGRVGTIVLVDGKRLTELMIEHGVGVSHKALKVPKLDSDYFEEA